MKPTVRTHWTDGSFEVVIDEIWTSVETYWRGLIYRDGICTRLYPHADTMDEVVDWATAEVRLLKAA